MKDDRPSPNFRYWDLNVPEFNLKMETVVVHQNLL